MAAVSNESEPRSKRPRRAPLDEATVFAPAWRTLGDDAIDRVAAAFTAVPDKGAVPGPVVALQHDDAVIQVYQRPFAACTLSNLFDETFLERVKAEFLKQKFEPRSNDLYRFEQTNDLRTSTAPALCALRNAIYSEGFVDLIARIAGVRLKQQVDISGHRYRDSNYLLCHDDELEGRKVAFILYLVPKDWSMDDGGRLEMFDCDEHGQPSTVSVRLVPRWNSIALFKVIPESFHQVSEVLTVSKDRLSISGWFYSDELVERPPPWLEPAPAVHTLPNSLADAATYADIDMAALQRWINSEYLKKPALDKIRTTFLEQSSVELHRFLCADVYVALSRAIASAAKTQHGPANRRLLLRVDKPTGELEELVTFATSNAFATWLSYITSLRLVDVQAELREFGSGHYTLVHDHSLERAGLDAVFHLTEPDATWDADHGGSLVYLAEDEVLLSSIPTPNSLLLVLRDEGVMRFVQYLDHHTAKPRRDLSLVYQPE